MAKFNFPNSPSTNDEYTANSVTWKYDGAVWRRISGVGSTQGAQGVQGATGSGAQGVQGATGSTGAQGVQGAQGHQGVQGATGSTGAQGVQGAQGHQGVQGAVGAQGHQGVQGAVGAQGAQGHQGVQGATGAGGGAGAQGYQGVQGAVGAQGAAGAAGAQGAQGHQGHQGVQGAQGRQGAQGVQGSTGSGGGAGAQGAQGHQGRQGSTGAVTYAVPSGGIIIWSGAANAIPSGWVLCNGSNSTPDLRDRFVVGAGSGYSVNNTGGAASVTLSTSEIPAHSHDAGTLDADNNGDHSHTWQRQDAQNDVGYRPWPASNNDVKMTNVQTSTEGDHGHNISGNTGNRGGGGSHENRPPYYALCYIMKT